MRNIVKLWLPLFRFNIFSRFSTMDIADLRTSYNSPENTFDVNNLVSRDPIEQFKSWFEDAKKHPAIKEPNAMAVATCTKNCMPSVRFCLLKSFDSNGFYFFTNYLSRKGQELEENPNISLAFYWDELSKQVRIEGCVEKVSAQVSDEYFHKRPVDSQIGASLCTQSAVIPDQKVLTDKYAELQETYTKPGQSLEVPKPESWGGFLVKPSVIEFWQGQTNRVHDRLRFRRPANNEVINPKLTHQGLAGWVFERLAP